MCEGGIENRAGRCTGSGKYASWRGVKAGNRCNKAAAGGLDFHNGDETLYTVCIDPVEEVCNIHLILGHRRTCLRDLLFSPGNLGFTPGFLDKFRG